MCYSIRKPVIRREEVKDASWMNATQQRDAHNKKAYAEAYAKTKQIMRKLLRTSKKEHVSAT